jgi:methylmalonyl-CoA mutase
VEKAGGAFATLTQNMIQRNVAATRDTREANVAKRRDVLTGASEFPNLHETPAAMLDVRPVTPAPRGNATITFDALAPMRLAVPFEKLRDLSDTWLKSNGSRPKVFLANLGTAADFTARATFVKSFFEAGGIEAVDFVPALPPNAPPHPNPLPAGEREKSAAEAQTASSPLPTGETSTPQASGEGRLVDRNPSPALSPLAQEQSLSKGSMQESREAALAAAFEASGARLVCLCSSDEIYVGQATGAAKAFNAAGASHIYLAGQPGELESALRLAGVQDFIFAGVDMVKTLNHAWRRLEQQ